LFAIFGLFVCTVSRLAFTYRPVELVELLNDYWHIQHDQALMAQRRAIDAVLVRCDELRPGRRFFEFGCKTKDTATQYVQRVCSTKLHQVVQVGQVDQVSQVVQIDANTTATTNNLLGDIINGCMRMVGRLELEVSMHLQMSIAEEFKHRSDIAEQLYNNMQSCENPVFCVVYKHPFEYQTMLVAANNMHDQPMFSILLCQMVKNAHLSASQQHVLASKLAVFLKSSLADNLNASLHSSIMLTSTLSLLGHDQLTGNHPAKPAKPATPAKPAKLAKLAKPAKPAKTAKPAKPAKPVKPAKRKHVE
jgi:hypothetical protein